MLFKSKENKGNVTLQNIYDVLVDIKDILASGQGVQVNSNDIDIPIADEEVDSSINRITDAVKNEVSRYYLSHSLKETESKYPFANAPLISIWFKEVNGVTKTELTSK